MILKYINSAGTSMSFATEKICITNGTLHGRTWKPETTEYNVGERVDYWTKEAYQFPLTITCRGSKRERINSLNNLHDLFEYDIAKNKPGTLYYGDWYCECFIISSKPSMADERPTWLNQEVTVYVPSATWWSEQKVSILLSTNTSGTKSVKYPTLYPFTYPAVANTIIPVSNTHYDTCDFILIAYGPTTGIDVTIGGNRYKVNYALESGETLTIDSRSSKEASERCYVTMANGTKVNVYNYRDSSTLLFKKIPAGNINISYNRTYGIDLTILKGRSEPKWQM